MPFIKNMASSGTSIVPLREYAWFLCLTRADRRLRNQSLDSLRAFLSSRKTLDPSEACKLWQGLYYALYMADRTLAQQALATDLGALVEAVPPSARRTWLRGFWAVMARRWTEIDAHRMNKFLLLVRRVLGGALGLARREEKGEDESVVEQTLVHGDSDENNAGPLTTRIDFGVMPVGLRMHVLDIWVDECDKAGLLGRAEGAEEEQDTRLARRIENLVDAVASTRGMAKAIRTRAKESLEDERLWWRRNGEAEGDGDGVADGADDNDSWDGFDD